MTKHTEECLAIEDVCHYEVDQGLTNILSMHLEKYAGLAFFNGLSPEEIQLMEPFFAPQSWVAGTTIFEQGDYAEYLYLVVQGEVAIHYKPDDGPVMTLTRVQAGSG